MAERKHILLAAINAKYIHSNLAVYSLKAYAKKYQNQIGLAEYTINQNPDDILKGIYRDHPEVLCISCYIWNISYVKNLIREVHKVLPDTAIWLGGPEVSYDARKVLEDLLAALREEYANTDPELSLTLEPLGHEADQAMDEASGRRCAELMYLLPYGVMKYDSCDRDVILNSVNTVRVTCENGVVEYEQMIRSPIDAYKWELVDRLRILAELTGASLVVQDSYAGWPFRKDSLQQLCCQVYNRLTGQELKIEKLNSCAETGEIAGAIPDMDIVALAPWGRGAHTPREHLDLDTLQPFWEFLTALLRAMCEEA